MKVKIRKSGILFIGITVFLGAAAVNTGNNLLYMVVSALLSFMFFSGAFSMLNLKGIRVSLVPPPEVFAGRENTFKVVLRKELPLPSFLIRVSSEENECVFPMVYREENLSDLRIRFNSRGLYESVEVKVSSSFPFGLFVRSFTTDVVLNIVVFPKPIPTDFRLFILSEDSKGEADSTTLYEGFEDIKNIKEYAGEPMKLIHWKLSAKRDELLVKEMVAEERSPVILELNSVKGSLEEKLGRLTYLVIELEKRGVPVGLKLGDKEIPPGLGESHRRLLLRELALFS
jgi:uncharacterized protein (DUF58 family)